MPLAVYVAVGEPIQAERIVDPGAWISTQGPKLENEDFASALVVAPTVIAEGARAGDLVHASLLSFPAATTTVIPLFVNLVTAASIVDDAPPPRDMFTTACVLGFGFSGESIHSIPAITCEYVPEPVQPRTLTGTIVAFLAIPYWVPAIVPAT